MASFNRIIMAGNLTKDPELKPVGAAGDSAKGFEGKQGNSGGMVCRLTIASNRQFKNRQTGLMTQEVCFVDVDVWGAQAESTNRYLRKGSPVLVEGRLRYDTWKDAEGNNRYRHAITADRVVFLGSRGESEAVGLSEDTQAYEPVAVEQPREKKSISKKKSDDPVFKDVSPFEEDLPF